MKVILLKIERFFGEFVPLIDSMKRNGNVPTRIHIGDEHLFTQLSRPKSCVYAFLFLLFCRLFEVELWIEMQDKNLMIYDCQWVTFRARRLTISLPLTQCVCVIESSVFTYDIEIENGVHWPHS